MDNAREYDVAIIGGGSAGYAAAGGTAKAGLRTTVIEGGEEVGGLCILRGCMPSKALLSAAEAIHLARHARTWGIQVGEISFDFAKVMERKRRLIREFADYRQQQLQTGDFSFIRARGVFRDEHTLELSDGTSLVARFFIVCTGSVIAPSPLPELRKAGYITSDDALSLTRLPKSLIVVGGGAVAVELAQFFVRFGVKVTLIQRSEHILSDMDTDAAEVIESVFRREGMTVYTGTNLRDASRTSSGKAVAFEHAGQTIRVEAEEILFALGRTADTAGLNLERIGVSTSGGRIITDATMQTTVPHIYAAGDCTGQHEIVHLAIQQAEVAAHNVAHADQPRQIDYRLLTLVIFTDPQAAVLGLSEKEAEIRGIPCSAARYPFADHGKAMILEARDGFVKLLANPKSGEIVGASCVGLMGGELIHEIIAAMSKRMTVHELAAMPHYHPTLAEIWTYPAEELAAKIPAPDGA